MASRPRYPRISVVFRPPVLDRRCRFHASGNVVQTGSPTYFQEDMMSTDPVNPEVPDEDRLDEPQTQFSEDEKSSRGPETEEELDEQVEDTFPASDPPANY
jgi:hypothetical protein